MYVIYWDTVYNMYIYRQFTYVIFVCIYTCKHIEMLSWNFIYGDYICIL